MLNRRHLRVRVLQTLYAYQASEIKEVKKEISNEKIKKKLAKFLKY